MTTRSNYWKVNPTREGNVRCKAFSHQGVKLNRVRVTFDERGEADLTVWDEVAGHFTRCHAIKPRRWGRIVAILTKGGDISEDEPAPDEKIWWMGGDFAGACE